MPDDDQIEHVGAAGQLTECACTLVDERQRAELKSTARQTMRVAYHRLLDVLTAIEDLMKFSFIDLFLNNFEI